MRRGFDEFFGFLHEGHYFRPAPYPGMTTWLRRKTLPGGQSGRWISHDGSLIFSDHLGRNEPEYDADNPIYLNGQPVVERRISPTPSRGRRSTSSVVAANERPTPA